MSSSTHRGQIVGQGDYRYAVATDWPRLPAGWSFVEATSVAVDAVGSVFVFNRGERPLIVLDAEGQVVADWGIGSFARPHGICITSSGAVWLADDYDHTVHKYTLSGESQLTLGTSGQPSDTGATSVDYRTIQRASGPFHYPTSIAVAPNGDVFVSDGYGNARIHHFSPDGEQLHGWGEPGSGPGQFHLPHGIAINSAGLIYVADRENSRIQLFDLEGEYCGEWPDLARPAEVFIDEQDVVYVAELGYRAGMFPGNEPPTSDATGGRISIFSPQGELLSRFGGGENPGTPGDFYAPHDLWVASDGTLYVAEVSWSAGGRDGKVPADIPSLHKFIPL